MVNNVASLIGRVFLTFIFIMSGVSKIWSYESTAGYMASKGIPFAPFFLFGAVLFELAGGLSLLTGYKARIGALLLIIFLIPTTFIFHLKPAFDSAMNVVDQKELIGGLKNIAIMGGLLLVYANGPGGWAVGKKA